jgi:hypothetical protein
MYPLTTTTARLDACDKDAYDPDGSGPWFSERWERFSKALNITETSDVPITYSLLLQVLGLDDALLCCQAEPDMAPTWRRYGLWCASQVRHLMVHEKSLAALDAAERYANGEATDEDLAAAHAAAEQVQWALWGQFEAGGRVSAAMAAAMAAAPESEWLPAWCARKAADAFADAAREEEWASGSGTHGRTAAAAKAQASAWAAARQHQAAAFRQLVTTGSLPD